jgi:transposase
MLHEKELRVCMDIGNKKHHVAVGLSSGEIIDRFDLCHTPNAITTFFQKIKIYEEQYSLPVAIAMEGYNGYARPMDKIALSKGYRLLNVNNNKLAQFKKVFAGPAKTDEIDALKMFELFALSDHLPIAKGVLQEISKAPLVNEKLKCLSRRRRVLVDDKIRIVNRLQSDLQAISPDFISITGSIDNIWFLNFLTAREDITKLLSVRRTSLLKIKGVGRQYANKILTWQKEAIFSPEAEWMGPIILSDAKRIIEIQDEIKKIEQNIEALSADSALAKRLRTIPGFGVICSAELAGEIGSIDRFHTEASLALYLGMAVLDNNSGNYKGTKRPKHVNGLGKAAMMVAAARHINHVEEAKRYYTKKRIEGKKHNQAVRSLGRQMIKVIWSMIKNQRDYEVK